MTPAETPEMFPEGDLNTDVAAEELARVYDDSPVERIRDAAHAIGRGEEFDAVVPPVEDDEDAEMARIFQQGATAADDDDDLVIDWDPTRGLPAEGIHPNCRLANVEKGTTGEKSKNPGTPSIIWYVTIEKGNQTVKKTVPMVNGGGIERKNIEFARLFGVEPKATQVRGSTQYSLKLSDLKKCIGLPCTAKVRHFNDMATLDDILPPSPAAAVADMPAYPDEEPF